MQKTPQSKELSWLPQDCKLASMLPCILLSVLIVNSFIDFCRHCLPQCWNPFPPFSLGEPFFCPAANAPWWLFAISKQEQNQLAAFVAVQRYAPHDYSELIKVRCLMSSFAAKCIVYLITEGMQNSSRAPFPAILQRNEKCSIYISAQKS